MNVSLLLPVYTRQRMRHAAVLTPFFLALGLTAGLAGAATRATSLYKFHQLSINTAASIEKLQGLSSIYNPSETSRHYGSTTSSGPALTGCRATGHLISMKEEHCFYYSQSEKAQEDTKGPLEQATQIQDLGSIDVWSPPLPSWLLPFLGPAMTILSGLLLGPCILQLLTKFICNSFQ